MKYVIHEFRRIDPNDLIPLLKGLRQYLMTINPNRKKVITEEFFENLIQVIRQQATAGQANVYVAEVDNKMIGYVYGVIKEQSVAEKAQFLPLKIGEIPELFVLEEYREQGIGSILMDSITTFFKNNGCNLLSLGVLESNVKSIEYYSKLGFRREYLEMVKST